MKPITADTKLRSQILDLIRYTKKTYGYVYPREKTKKVLDTYYGSICLDTILTNLEFGGHPDRNKVFLDGDESSHIYVSIHELQSDLEYFDSLCYNIAPSEYQLKEYEEYEQYKHLKFKYEGVVLNGQPITNA